MRTSDLEHDGITLLFEQNENVVRSTITVSRSRVPLVIDDFTVAIALKKAKALAKKHGYDVFYKVIESKQWENIPLKEIMIAIDEINDQIKELMPRAVINCSWTEPQLTEMGQVRAQIARLDNLRNNLCSLI